MKKFFSRIYHSPHVYPHKNYWLLLILCTIFIILRFPSLYEPSWYGDEGIYQVVGASLNDGRVLYKEIWDNKPPLLYIIYALAGADLFTVRLLSVLSGLFSVVVFYFLARQLFKKQRSIFIASFVYVLIFGLPIIEGNIANAENFLLFPIVTAAYFVNAYVKNKKNSHLIYAGFLLSIAFITKIVAVFDFAAFIIFISLFTIDKKKELFKKGIIFGISFLSLFIISCIYFLASGAFSDFMNGVFFQNVSYVGEQFGAANPVFMLSIKTIALAIIVSILTLYKRKISTPVLFIFLWIAFGIYNSLFSDRPYTHYLIVLLPSVSLLIGLFVDRPKTRIAGLIVIVLIILLAKNHFGYYRKNIAYYNNYIQYLTDNKTTTQYQMFFDRNTPRDYLIANYINLNTMDNEKVFLISDSAQIYALSNKLPIGKYIVAYHITYFKNAIESTQQQVKKERPKYIIQTTKEPILEDLLSSYELRYIMEGAMIYEEKI